MKKKSVSESHGLDWVCSIDFINSTNDFCKFALTTFWLYGSRTPDRKAVVQVQDKFNIDLSLVNHVKIIKPKLCFYLKLLK